MSSSNRRPYLGVTTLTQATLDACQDNLENGLRMVAQIGGPTGTIYVSDQSCYVDGNFYQALAKFPTVTRTVGEWLAGQATFATMQLQFSNVDGRYSHLMPGGADFGGWIGRTVTVQVGVGESAGAYTTIFAGRITDVGGVARDTVSITLTARDKFDVLKNVWPLTVFNVIDYPDIELSMVGIGLPVIYGDWLTDTTTLRQAASPTEAPAGAQANIALPVASVPAYPTNGLNAGVRAGTSNLKLKISLNALKQFNTTKVYLVRGDTFWLIASADIANVAGDNSGFEIIQNGATVVDGGVLQYSSGDTFMVRVIGMDLGSYTDNLIWQAQDILVRYGGLTGVGTDLDANWTTYRDKNPVSYPESQVATFKSRVWVQTATPLIDYVVSMLEQVRLELYVSRSLMLKINSLQLDDFPAPGSISPTVRNWDVVQGTFSPALDAQINWNRAVAEYGFDPSLNAQNFATPVFINAAAITQAGKKISKKIVFPNLYVSATVILQLKELLKIAGAFAEMVAVTLTPRSFLRDIGDFATLSVTIGGITMVGVPAMIRDIGYDPKGLGIPAKYWSFQMLPYPGWTPGLSGTTGGNTATIAQE